MVCSCRRSNGVGSVRSSFIFINKSPIVVIDGCKTWSVTASEKYKSRIMCNIVILDLVHRLNCKIATLRRFGSWILLSSSGKWGGGGRKPLCSAPWLS
jgi:hypothetical protein